MKVYGRDKGMKVHGRGKCKDERKGRDDVVLFFIVLLPFFIALYHMVYDVI